MHFSVSPHLFQRWDFSGIVLESVVPTSFVVGGYWGENNPENCHCDSFVATWWKIQFCKQMGLSQLCHIMML